MSDLPHRTARTGIKALTMKLSSWQARTTLLIATLGPFVASVILMTTTYLFLCEGLTEPVSVHSFMVAFIFFALPVGYAFGVVPALLAGAMYCGALTAIATLRPGMLLRSCLGAISGGLIGEVWFHAVVGSDSHVYGSVAALVLALLSLRLPPAGTRQFGPREMPIQLCARNIRQTIASRDRTPPPFTGPGRD
jgi:hypothetical protein